MPVSKKRKKKSRYKSPPPSSKQKVAPKKKLTRRQILIYTISIAMIISLAASYIIGSGSQSAPVPTPPAQVQPVEDDNQPSDSGAETEDGN